MQDAPMMSKGSDIKAQLEGGNLRYSIVYGKVWEVSIQE